MLATFALALLAGTAVAATVENIIIKDGDRSYINGDGHVHEYRDLGDRYASFELDGVRYVLTDEKTLDEIAEVIEPQVELGKKQAKLGEKQAALGAEQAKLGAEQARLGLQQASTRDSDRQNDLAAEQRELATQQRELGDRQRVLGDQQRELGEQQRVEARRAEGKLQKIFEKAVRSGIARRR